MHLCFFNRPYTTCCIYYIAFGRFLFFREYVKKEFCSENIIYSFISTFSVNFVDFFSGCTDFYIRTLFIYSNN